MVLWRLDATQREDAKEVRQECAVRLKKTLIEAKEWRMEWGVVKGTPGRGIIFEM